MLCTQRSKCTVLRLRGAVLQPPHTFRILFRMRFRMRFRIRFCIRFPRPRITCHACHRLHACTPAVIDEGRNSTLITIDPLSRSPTFNYVHQSTGQTHQVGVLKFDRRGTALTCT